MYTVLYSVMICVVVERERSAQFSCEVLQTGVGLRNFIQMHKWI